MIYFYDDLVNKTFETVKQAHDCVDMLNDFRQIEYAMQCAKLGNAQPGLSLDEALRRKYPIITHMIQYAAALSNSFAPPAGTLCEQVFSALQEDLYGILCHAAIQKGIVENMKAFIREVR